MARWRIDYNNDEYEECRTYEDAKKIVKEKEQYKDAKFNHIKKGMYYCYKYEIWISLRSRY